MMMSRFLLLLGFVLASALAARPAAAEPPTPAACGEAFADAQRLSQEGKLISALEKLIVCAQPTCPPFLTRECTATFERIKQNVPTVTLSAVDERGTPLAMVTVTLDGQPLTTRMDGRAFPLDPGLHEFVFTREGKPPLTVTTLVSEGDKNKPVVAQFVSKESEAKPAVTDPPPPSGPPADSAKGGIPVATYVLGGVGVAAIAIGVVFRATADSDYNGLADSCGRECTKDQVDPISTKYTMSTVAFGVGAGALVAAGVFFLVGRSSSNTSTASIDAPSLSLQPHFLTGGGGGVLSGRF